MARTKTSRGFAGYDTFTDDAGCEIRVQQSSSAMAAKVWLFCKNTAGAYHDRPREAEVSPHLTVKQAKRLIAALQAFVAENE